MESFNHLLGSSDLIDMRMDQVSNRVMVKRSTWRHQQRSFAKVYQELKIHLAQVFDFVTDKLHLAQYLVQCPLLELCYWK